MSDRFEKKTRPAGRLVHIHPTRFEGRPGQFRESAPVFGCTPAGAYGTGTGPEGKGFGMSAEKKETFEVQELFVELL
jgi:hypothetical protein